MDSEQQQTVPTEKPPQTSSTPPIQPRPKSKKRLILTISAAVLVLLAGSGIAYALLGNKETSNTKQDNQTQTSQQDQQVSYIERWLYTNEQEKQVYTYDSADNKSTPIIKLAEGEQVSVSPDGKTLVRTRKNVIETAVSSEKPEFKQVYADADQSVGVFATWLPDGSGFIVNAAKLTNPQDDNGDYWVPRYVYTVTRIKADGSEPKKLFEYPVAYGAIHIEGVDLQRDELYLSEDGEGGSRVALGVYRLSDGAKLRHYEQSGDTGVLAVANGKAFMSNTVSLGSSLNSPKKAQVTEINLDNGEEKVIYESTTVQGRTFQRNGSEFIEGIRVLNLKVSQDKSTLYFDEIHIQENSETRLKSIDLNDGNVKEIYTPTTIGHSIAVETQIATTKGVIVRVNCSGCASDEYNKLGNEWIFINPTDGKWQTIQKTGGDVYLQTFKNIQIPVTTTD